ncbi:lipid droplet-associated protein [Mycobacterium deserti]|uniref:Lipid droplet-associated protein n=1 Tax=Mycobacterium deserti TaxID=2978347 RepID=A0ABT2M4P2_9MYCO|nr:lipid droplet-associated protein [Mycobacterium deserti]MCT7657230.1 lipid droplet-associated protein [Mycobacterium deserti]
MATAPFGVRLLVGAAVTAVEETRKLPQTILTYPMTVVSQIAHLVMKVQQDVADLVNKGDETLESIFPPKDEQPEWATFDEDLDDGPPTASAGDGERLTEGRFALFSGGEPEAPTEPGQNGAPTAPADAPEIVTELDYESLTLAQLRARLNTLRVADLEALLAYEDATKARAPFQTLLANRITRATAK